MSQIVLYLLHITLVVSSYIGVVFRLSISDNNNDIIQEWILVYSMGIKINGQNVTLWKHFGTKQH